MLEQLSSTAFYSLAHSEIPKRGCAAPLAYFSQSRWLGVNNIDEVMLNNIYRWGREWADDSVGRLYNLDRKELLSLDCILIQFFHRTIKPANQTYRNKAQSSNWS